jgi:hypothetical protein
MSIFAIILLPATVPDVLGFLFHPSRCDERFYWQIDVEGK